MGLAATLAPFCEQKKKPSLRSSWDSQKLGLWGLYVYAITWTLDYLSKLYDGSTTMSSDCDESNRGLRAFGQSDNLPHVIGAAPVAFDSDSAP
jgi:hypothetical protein